MLVCWLGYLAQQTYIFFIIYFPNVTNIITTHIYKFHKYTLHGPSKLRSEPWSEYIGSPSALSVSSDVCVGVSYHL